ncbi:MAG: hypothetical protein KF901_07255 [Myxococcales bacterium]|nr:hypothetical protein [Myxococcales bacterium]
MSAWRELRLSALLAAAGVGLAIWATRPGGVDAPGEATALDCGRATEVVLEAETRRVRIYEDGREVRVEVLRREDEDRRGPAGERLRFLGGESARAYLAAASPLRARRGLGIISAEAAGELGLEAPTSTWSVSCDGPAHRFALGGHAYGTGDRYARRERDHHVFLLPSPVVREVENAELRLMERRLHRFERAEAAGAELTLPYPDEPERAPLRLRMQQRNRRSPDATWVDDEAPDVRRRDYDAAVRAVLGLAIIRYLDEAPEPLGTHLLDARFVDVAGRPLGELSLHRSGEGAQRRWIARSDASGGHVEILASAGAAAERALERLAAPDASE